MIASLAPLSAAKSWLDAICGALAAERPLWLLLTLSGTTGLAYCAWLFDLDFILGRSAFWLAPHGIVGNGAADMPAALSGYLYFQRDAWQWPLFHIPELGTPAGLNIIFTDSIPWVALAGRLVFRVTGMAVNLYGAWTLGCFIAAGMSLTGLVAKLGQRNIAAAFTATIAGLCMPALLARWGHMSLMAQFQIPLALIFYATHHRANRGGKLLLHATGLTWLALWTQAYLFVMVIAIISATILQAVSRRTLGWRTGIAVSAVLVGGLGGLIALSGHLQSAGALAVGTDSDFFSMNLLSPIIPQHSGLMANLRHRTADGTGRQYEGFSYLGAGTILLLAATSTWQARILLTGLRRHAWLWMVLLGCTLFALSNTIYAARFQLLHIPLPESVIGIAAMFRSTGRFFWPVMYCLTALAIVAVLPNNPRRGALMLCAAVLLQWFDTAPLRHALAASTRGPDASMLDDGAWRAAIARHRSVRVLPQNICLPLPVGWESRVAVHLQLLAAQLDRPINSVYAARYAADCAAEQRLDATPRQGANQLSVIFEPFVGFAHMRELAVSTDHCRAGPGIVVCSDKPEETPFLADLTRITGR